MGEEGEGMIRDEKRRQRDREVKINYFFVSTLVRQLVAEPSEVFK